MVGRRREAVHRRADHDRPRGVRTDWKQHHGKDATASVEDLADDPDLLAEIDVAVDEANQAVSKAEAIRKFTILPVDFTVTTGELTPSLKLKRNVVAAKFADEIESLYS